MRGALLIIVFVTMCVALVCGGAYGCMIYLGMNAAYGYLIGVISTLIGVLLMDGLTS